MGAYIPAVTFSGVTGAWTQPLRLTVSEDGWIAGFRVSMASAVSAASQVRIEIGHGWGASAASAYLTQQIMIQDVPAAAGNWNVSNVGGAAGIVEVQNFGGDAIDYNYRYPVAAPSIYSGGTIRNSGGLWARARVEAGSGGAGEDFTLLVKER